MNSSNISRFLIVSLAIIFIVPQIFAQNETVPTTLPPATDTVTNATTLPTPVDNTTMPMDQTGNATEVTTTTTEMTGNVTSTTTTLPPPTILPSSASRPSGDFVKIISGVLGIAFIAYTAGHMDLFN